MNTPLTSQLDETWQKLLKGMLATIPSDIAPKHRNEVENILQRQKAAFSLSENDVGFCTKYTHKLQLKDANQHPVQQKLRRQAPLMQWIVNEEVQ